MLSFSVFKAITLILVLSNILEIEAFKCFQNLGVSDKAPMSLACDESTPYCKNVTSGSQLRMCLHQRNKEWRINGLILIKFEFLSFLDEGTSFSCTALENGDTVEVLPKCVENTKTCYCKSDDCNVKPKIKCPVGDDDDKKEQECQPGIVNCKNTTTSKPNIQTIVYF